ncbi:MAG: hypothetical protein QM715_17260 [Nibricoccus sp.]
MRRSAFFVSFLVLASGSSIAASTLPTWTSAITGKELPLTVHVPARPADKTEASALPTVLYLQNLAAPRAGTDSDDAIVSDLLAQGCQVVAIDFGRDPKTRLPALNLDLAKLRDDIRVGKFSVPIAIDQSRVYIVPSGHRLLRDIVYYRDAGRTLCLDLIYPSNPAKAPGIVLEFSCDNKDRMGNVSLSACNDTILDGEATEGFAVAMADHPVAAPYKGIDAMPECAWKIKAAVRTLRATARGLALDEKIVPVGFSRGSGMALMLVTTAGMQEFEGHGEQLSIDSAVQGGVIMSGRFTYLDLLPEDHMIPRYEKAWGTLEKSADVWKQHGALDYLQNPTLPLFLTINCTEAPEALYQMDILRRRLSELKSPFIYHLDQEPRGHKVAREPIILEAIDRYLKDRLH